VEATITMAKDGRVLSSRITKQSGILAVDRSVQNALDDVHRVPGFKATPTNQLDRFTFVFNFDVKSNSGSLDWPPKSPSSTIEK
jgi:outer membrane biosynthesis protein TonB